MTDNKSESDHSRRTCLNVYVLSKNNKKKEKEKMGLLKIIHGQHGIIYIYIYVYIYTHTYTYVSVI